MELEFDKEIDVILRRSRPARGVLVGDDPKKHVDADAIAAFAENALPQKTKLLYMEHFAECDRCRGRLALSSQMNGEAVAAAASTVAAPIPIDAAVPWYQRLFRTPSMAVAMAALVLAFSGGLVYLLLQSSQAEQGATVSQVTDAEAQRGGPFLGEEPTTGANANANAAGPSAPAADKPAANVAANTAEGPPAGAGTRTGGRTNTGETLAVRSEDDKNVSSSEVAGAPPAAAQPAPPPPKPMASETVAEKENKTDADAKDEAVRDLELSKRKYAEDRRRDLPPAASKSGPVRSGPLNQRNQVQMDGIEVNTARIVAGKSFTRRDGAWYDSSYRGQSTINVRRGTTQFTSLDGGLRSIANSLSGVVVVMWQGKAYRIQ